MNLRMLRCASTTLALFALFAAPAAAAPQLPDLVADAPVPRDQAGFECDGPCAPEVYNDGGGNRLLLRMDGFVHNAGQGALEIRGSGNSNGTMTQVVQRVYDGIPVFGFQDRQDRSPQVGFATADGHDHFHLRHAMRYSMWSTDRAREVAPSQKVGFCLIDSERRETDRGPSRRVYTIAGHDFCDQGNPTKQQTVMGVSAGWRDEYPSSLTFQWVDVSDTAPGVYVMRADADPDDVVIESQEANAPGYATTTSTVPGFLAQPVAAGTLDAGTSSTIALAAQRFGTTQSTQAQYMIVTAPSAGTLDKPVGTWFSGAQVRYTSPSSPTGGNDSFTYVARDVGSEFPRTPPSAAVTLGYSGTSAPVPGPAPGSAPAPVSDSSASRSIAISGAPASVLTGSTTKLSATGAGAAGGVTWSVRPGGPGGAAGTISAAGVYVAPAVPPNAGFVVVRAQNAAGIFGEVAIRILAAPAPRPAPSIGASGVPARGVLSRIRLGRHKGKLIATVTSSRYGRLRFVARRRGVTIGRCSTIAQAGSSTTCSMKLASKGLARAGVLTRAAFYCRLATASKLDLPGVRVTAKLTRGGKAIATRTVTTR